MLFFPFLISCIDNTDPKRHAVYIENRNSFDTTLVRFFPPKLPKNHISVGFSPISLISSSDWDHAGIYLTTQLDSEEKFMSVKEDYMKQSLDMLNSQDSCLLLISAFGKIRDDYFNDNCEVLYPIPPYSLGEFNYDVSAWTRYEDTDIIILDYKLGVFIDELKVNKRDNIPDKFQHGYSTGISTDNKKLTIQYWLIVW